MKRTIKNRTYAGRRLKPQQRNKDTARKRAPGVA